MEIADIKQNLSILTVLTHYGHKPDRNNRVKCMWHDDKTPSLQIYPATNTYTCFSSNCTAGSGDAIDMIMKIEQCNKHEALIKAAELLGLSRGIDIQREEVKPSKEKVSVLTRSAILAKYYQSTLQSITQSHHARAYAEKRNLDYNKLNIGFAGTGIGDTWTKELKESAESMGLMKIRNCLIFATKNKDGQIASIYGRCINPNPNVKHFYLLGGFKGLYPSYPKAETKTIILVESIIDAATLRQAQGATSQYEVLALYGTNGFTVEHEEAIKGLAELNEIILFFDGDEAGRAAVAKYKESLKILKPNIKISVVNTPKGEDPNSLIQGHEPKILTHLIEQRQCIDLDPQISVNEKSTLNPQSSTLDTSNPELIVYETEKLHITILGGIKITGLDRMRVTLKIELKAYSSSLPIRHSLDLYHTKQVEQLTEKMAGQVSGSTTEAERTINGLTTELERYRQEKLELMKPKKEETKQLSEAEKSAALAYLKDPKLMTNTLADIVKSGIVGEVQNSLIAYLTYTSRKREKPLHIICLGASGTGKTYLQEKISELIPEEEKIEITTLSDNALYYFGREELKHKLILIEDLDGAENILYPLRELQSKRKISKTVTLKDNKGNLKTITLEVEGPVCVSGCTTRERIYDDNANRSILLYIDDSPEQDKRIMEYQQKASAGQVNTGDEAIVRDKLKNVQRLLKSIKVINPYAEIIDLPQEVFKPRRTLMLLLSFIETVTFYHQYQRPLKTNDETKELYIETTKEDIEIAFRLMKHVLFSKSDELSKAARNFLEILKKKTVDEKTFYAGSLRKEMRLTPSTMKRHLIDLVRNGYINIKSGSKHRGFEYEVSDYEEYQKLKSNIDEKLGEILAKIKVSGPVAQEWPTSENGSLKVKTINDLKAVAQ
jgi:DNA primase